MDSLEYTADGRCLGCNVYLIDRWPLPGYTPHTHEGHASRRRQLLGAFATMLDQAERDRMAAEQGTGLGHVMIRLRSGVCRQLVTWHPVSPGFWDEPGPFGREWLLRELRSRSSLWTLRTYGITVNPATWTHCRIYEPEAS